MDWKKYQEPIKEEAQTKGTQGRFGAGLPRISDGQLLFLQHMISKMRTDEVGSRIGIVMNGSPLFTGGAGSGEREIRRWMLETIGLTGQTFRHAERQYRYDRAPANEPLLTFKRGALVHFAVDQDNVSMTTRLQNGKTRFLPFNRGNSGGAGNPDIKNEFRVAYLWADQPEGKAIFSRDILLDIIGRFVHLDISEGRKR